MENNNDKKEQNIGSDKGFGRDLNEIMQFPKEGIFSTVLAKSDIYNYTLMCLAGGTDIDTHTSAKNGIVQIKIFSILGEHIATILNKYQETGKYSIDFDAGHLAAGLYIYQLIANDFIKQKKLLLVK